MSTTPVPVGIVGLGFMGAMHVKAYRKIPQARIAALCSQSGRNLDGDFSKVAGNLGPQESVRLDMKGVQAARDFGELLKNPEIQLVDICTPTRTHAEFVLRALKAGKHVICEKPLARTSELALAITQAAEGAKTYFMPAMCVRFWPEFAWLKQTTDSQRFGKVLDARLRRVAEPPGWGHDSYFKGAESGGALFDLHIHDVDFVQYCFGRPVSVYATGYSKVSGAIDHVMAHFRMEGGAAISVEGSWSMAPGFGFHNSFTVNYEKATVDFDLARGAEKLKLFEPGKAPQVITCEGDDGYVAELRHMIDCIQKQTPPRVVTARDALRAVEICEAEELSIRTGQVVSIS